VDACSREDSKYTINYYATILFLSRFFPSKYCIVGLLRKVQCLITDIEFNNHTSEESTARDENIATKHNGLLTPF
jgi:hypothetical protein